MKTLIKNVSLNDSKVDVLIEGEKFSKIANNIEEKADTIIDGTNKAIMPAFYNTHNHISMTLLKGIGEDKDLFVWLSKDIWPREDKLTAEDIYIASKFAILELIKGGTVFFNDMYPFVEETMKAIDEMGIRASVSIVQFDLFDKKQTEKKIQATKDFVNLKNPNEKRIIKTIAVHAVYTVSEELLDLAAKVAKENDMFLHIHASETEKEVKDCIEKYGCTPIQKLEKHGLLTEKTILAHCVHLNDNDIEIINKYKVKISHCPVSNQKLCSGNMPLQKLLDKNCFITLGTDGSSSNNSLSMIDEMKVCALNAKNQAKSPLAGKVNDIFKIATENGAKAFNINAGEIKEGKLADFVLYDLNNYHLIPNFNLVSNIIYSADNSAISDVFCDGKPIMLNGKVKDEEKIIEDFKKLAEKFK